jgi:hypothetical protein
MTRAFLLFAVVSCGSDSTQVTQPDAASSVDAGDAADPNACPKAGGARLKGTLQPGRPDIDLRTCLWNGGSGGNSASQYYATTFGAERRGGFYVSGGPANATTLTEISGLLWLPDEGPDPGAIYAIARGSTLTPGETTTLSFKLRRLGSCGNGTGSVRIAKGKATWSDGANPLDLSVVGPVWCTHNACRYWVGELPGSVVFAYLGHQATFSDPTGDLRAAIFTRYDANQALIGRWCGTGTAKGRDADLDVTISNLSAMTEEAGEGSITGELDTR